MSYNPRMSMAPPPSQQKSRVTKKEEESDAFMRLPDKEIAGCISDIGVPFTAADLQKPNPLQIQQIFQWFAELLMNATHDTIGPAMRAAAEDVCGEYMDVVPSDVRNLMGFYMSLRKLLLECGVHDFSFQDLQKPTHERLSKIFSYIINFVRFRESQTGVIDEHFNKAETTKGRIETLYMENQEMEARLEEMRRNRKAMESHVSDKVKRNQELKQRLRALQVSQTEVMARYDGLQKKKDELTHVLEDKTATAINLRQESGKLRPYVLQSPAALQATLTDLGASLSNEKAHIDSLDRRARALQTSTDTFGVVSTDVASVSKILEETAAELQKEDEENVKNSRQRDALSERGNNVREVEREESLLKRQLAKYNERTEKLREGSREKAQSAKERMEELRAVHRTLTEERGDKGREMERRRVRIEQTEKKMVDLKENIENEIHTAHDEFLKMDSHIKLYITEMEQSL
ncbi:kinetochore-associated Ndc80 complex subunit nuf2 [Pseudogymnoascus australis]